jgi:hypothetical protein
VSVFPRLFRSCNFSAIFFDETSNDNGLSGCARRRLPPTPGKTQGAVETQNEDRLKFVCLGSPSRDLFHRATLIQGRTYATRQRSLEPLQLLHRSIRYPVRATEVMLSSSFESESILLISRSPPAIGLSTGNKSSRRSSVSSKHHECGRESMTQVLADEQPENHSNSKFGSSTTPFYPPPSCTSIADALLHTTTTSERHRSDEQESLGQNNLDPSTILPLPSACFVPAYPFNKKDTEIWKKWVDAYGTGQVSSSGLDSLLFFPSSILNRTCYTVGFSRYSIPA